MGLGGREGGWCYPERQEMRLLSREEAELWFVEEPARRLPFFALHVSANCSLGSVVLNPRGKPSLISKMILKTFLNDPHWKSFHKLPNILGDCPWGGVAVIVSVAEEMGAIDMWMASRHVTRWVSAEWDHEPDSILVPFSLAVPPLGRWHCSYLSHPWPLRWDWFTLCHCHTLFPCITMIEFHPESGTLPKAPLWK